MTFRKAGNPRPPGVERLPADVGIAPIDMGNFRPVVGRQPDSQFYRPVELLGLNHRLIGYPGWRGRNRRRLSVADAVDGPHLKGVGRPVGQILHRMACGLTQRHALRRRRPPRVFGGAIPILIGRDGCAAVVGWGLPCQRHRLVGRCRHKVLRRTRSPRRRLGWRIGLQTTPWENR